MSGKGEAAEKSQRLLQWQRAQFLQRAVGDAHVARLFAQARTLAFRADAGVEVFRQFLAHGGRIGLAVATLQIVDDALERMRAQRWLAALVEVAERNLFLAGAVQHHLLDILRQAFVRTLQVEVVMFGQAIQHLVIELVAPVPALDRAAAEREGRKGDNPPGIEETDIAQAVALGAGAHRVVEREQARLQFR